MDFDATHDHLIKALELGLPGPDIQYLMAPTGRSERAIEARLRPDLRKGGVLVFLYPINGKTHLVLTQRHAYDGVHGDQVSLPGGKVEPEDKNREAAALREAQEEVNVDLQKLQVIGHLTELFIPPSNFLILPVVAMAHERPDLKPELAEVREIMEVPLQTLMAAGVVKKTEMRMADGAVVEVPYFDLLGKQVWGATAMILSGFKEILNRQI